MTQRRKPLTGASSVPLLDWRGRQTKVWRDISTVLFQCVALHVDYRLEKMKVKWILELIVR